MIKSTYELVVTENTKVIRQVFVRDTVVLKNVDMGTFDAFLVLLSVKL